jgi:hypothetical protein
MKISPIKILLAVSLSLMVVLAITGVFVVAKQSSEQSIVVPPTAVKTLPSQAPERNPVSPYIKVQPQDIPSDAPKPR